MKVSKLVLLFFCGILFASCLSTKTFLKNDQIPSDFGKGNSSILIIPSPNKKVNRAVENAFDKYYKGGFEIGQKSTGKRNAASHYYTFNTYLDFNRGEFTSYGRQAPSTDIYFGITDLQTNKTYKNLRFGNYNKCAKLFVQALEMVRKRNE